MFEEIKKYGTNGHFFFNKGDTLSIVSKAIPNLPGVYYIIKLALGKIELVYIGKSGTIQQNGTFKEQLLRDRINNKHNGMKRQIFFDNKMEDENIDALDVYWFVTHNEINKDLPAFVEGLLIQRYYDTYGKLPPWNKEF